MSKETLDIFKLRYTVELTTKEAFTASNVFDDEPDVVRFINQLRNLNKKLKYKRFSRFILYKSNSNEQIRDYKD